MSIPNEALQKLLVEIEQKAALTQQQLGVVRSQIGGKKREKRMMELTMEEVKSLPKGVQIYEGVGKMFVLTPEPDIQKRLKADTDGVRAEITGLEKKLHYLEMTDKNSREHIEKIFSSTGR